MFLPEERIWRFQRACLQLSDIVPAMTLAEELSWLATDGGLRSNDGARLCKPEPGATRNSVENAGKLSIGRRGIALFTLQFGEYRDVPDLPCQGDGCEVRVCVQHRLDDGDRRVTAVIFELDPKAVARWQEATYEGADDLYALVFAREETKELMAADDAARAAAIAELQEAAAAAPLTETFGWRWFGQGEHRAIHVEPGMGSLSPVVYHGLDRRGRLLRIVLDFHYNISEWSADEDDETDAPRAVLTEVQRLSELISGKKASKPKPPPKLDVEKLLEEISRTRPPSLTSISKLIAHLQTLAAAGQNELADALHQRMHAALEQARSQRGPR